MIRLAIVEDNYHYRSALVKHLEGFDFMLKGVYSSAEEALPHLLVHKPDIAIVDIQLGVMSGISLIQKMRLKSPQTQFLVCTAHQDNDNIFNALKAGASGYILKDTTGEDIRKAVKELFMGGAPMSPNIARSIITSFRQNKGNVAIYGLSERETEVLKLMSDGLLNKEIAEKLFISCNTIKNHLKNIYKKLSVQNKIEAVNKYHNKYPYTMS